ncbi:MAG: hypothetical protein JW982_09665 [Spirochaetes bacterium]|nr:hypothetical protein [Spirochaetota bacterium]
MAVVFAGAAMLLSLAVGFISGNNITIIILRAVIFSIIFSVIGFGSVIVIKKYIPEFYNIVFSAEIEHSGTEGNIDSDSMQFENKSPNYESINSFENETSIEEDMPESDDYSGGSENASNDNYADEALNNISGSKMGKHILEEKGMQFEPKLMAEAIRTMMSKDE